MIWSSLFLFGLLAIFYCFDTWFLLSLWPWVAFSLIFVVLIVRFVSYRLLLNSFWTFLLFWIIFFYCFLFFIFFPQFLSRFVLPQFLTIVFFRWRCLHWSRCLPIVCQIPEWWYCWTFPLGLDVLFCSIVFNRGLWRCCFTCYLISLWMLLVGGRSGNPCFQAFCDLVFRSLGPLLFNLSVCSLCCLFGYCAHFLYVLCMSIHLVYCVFWVRACYIVWLGISLHDPILVICSIPWYANWSHQPLLLVSHSFLLPLLNVRFLHSIGWFDLLLPRIPVGILRIFGVVQSLCLYTFPGQRNYHSLIVL